MALGARDNDGVDGAIVKFIDHLIYNHNVIMLGTSHSES